MFPREGNMVNHNIIFWWSGVTTLYRAYGDLYRVCFSWGGHQKYNLLKRNLKVVTNPPSQLVHYLTGPEAIPERLVIIHVVA